MFAGDHLQNQSAPSVATKHHLPAQNFAPVAEPLSYPGLRGKNRATPVVPTTGPESEPVVVRPKKGRAQTSEEPSAEWDPWTDGDPLYDISTPLPQQPQEKPLTDLQRIAEGKARLPRPAPEQVPQISGPQRKYSHLPLVADELKQDAERRSAPDSAESRKPGHKA